MPNLDARRCEGLYPDGEQCPRRDDCLRYVKAMWGAEMIEPRVEGGQCYDRVTLLGEQMRGR